MVRVWYETINKVKTYLFDLHILVRKEENDTTSLSICHGCEVDFKVLDKLIWYLDQLDTRNVVQCSYKDQC